VPTVTARAAYDGTGVRMGTRRVTGASPRDTSRVGWIEADPIAVERQR